MVTNSILFINIVLHNIYLISYYDSQNFNIIMNNDYIFCLLFNLYTIKNTNTKTQ